MDWCLVIGLAAMFLMGSACGMMAGWLMVAAEIEAVNDRLGKESVELAAVTAELEHARRKLARIEDIVDDDEGGEC